MTDAIRNAVLSPKPLVMVILPMAVFVADLLAYGINFSILYLAILAALGLTLTAPQLRQWVLLLVVLTLLGYFLKYQQVVKDHQVGYTNFRLFNRVLVSTSLLALVPVLAQVRHRLLLGDRFRNQLDSELRQRDDFEGLLAWLVPGLLLLLSMLLLVLIATADLMLPSRFNFPIIYALFLMVAGMFASRRLLWGTLGLLLALTFAGYFLGHPPSREPEPWWRLIMANRFLAGSAMLGIAWLLDRRIIALQKVMRQQGLALR